MLISEVFTNNHTVWHGYKRASYAELALQTNAMLGTSIQRWWPDDRHYTDDQGDLYNNSYWMKGISLTRDRKYAEQWGDVIFALDRMKIAQRYRIIPFSWAKTFGRNDGWVPNFKREREEYVILEKKPLTYKDDREGLFKPANRKLEPLSTYLLGIWVDSGAKSYITETILKHRLFRGEY